MRIEFLAYYSVLFITIADVFRGIFHNFAFFRIVSGCCANGYIYDKLKAAGVAVTISSEGKTIAGLISSIMGLKAIAANFDLFKQFANQLEKQSFENALKESFDSEGQYNIMGTKYDSSDNICWEKWDNMHYVSKYNSYRCRGQIYVFNKDPNNSDFERISSFTGWVT